MGGREPVTAARLKAFLEALGRAFRHPARITLSGGEALVWRGLRDSTRDVDVALDVDPRWHGELIRTLRDLIVETSTSVEEASPADFIPLPEGAELRTSHVGRFGSIDVFLGDPYSQALSKLTRAHQRDRDDVRALIAAGVVDPRELRRLFEAILPECERRGLRIDLDRFRAALDSVAPPPAA